MIAIQSVQLSKSYGFYKIFEDLSFTIDSGECFVLFGPNGAGKTTLLQVLATLTRPTSGRFEILGYDGITEKSAIRNSVMILAHGSYLYDDLNAIENLQFASALRGKSPTLREITRALDFVDIGAFQDLKIRFFSAGMKKRLGLAKVFLIQPEVLFLDEPYNALDDAGVVITNDLIRDLLKRGGTAFMTTHDRIKATQVASQAGILHQGTLNALTLDSLMTNDLS
jgi:heme exporter protein A